MRHPGFCFCLLAALLSLELAPLDSQAAVYRFVDDRGVIHFTNVPEDDRYEWIPTSPSAITERQRERNAVVAPTEDTYDHLIVRAARNNRVRASSCALPAQFDNMAKRSRSTLVFTDRWGHGKNLRISILYGAYGGP